MLVFSIRILASFQHFQYPNDPEGVACHELTQLCRRASSADSLDREAMGKAVHASQALVDTPCRKGTAQDGEEEGEKREEEQEEEWRQLRQGEESICSSASSRSTSFLFSSSAQDKQRAAESQGLEQARFAAVKRAGEPSDSFLSGVATYRPLSARQVRSFEREQVALLIYTCFSRV